MYHQYATGTFTATLTGPYHCGPNNDSDSPRTFRYEVDIRYDVAASLDARGFLLDNMEFNRYFMSITETDLSCERIAECAARYFKALVPATVSVQLWGVPDAARVGVTI